MAAAGRKPAIGWRPAAWPWPLPALLAWVLAWALWRGGMALGLAAPLAWGAALALGVALALACQGLRRRLLAAAGFPVLTLALDSLPLLPAWGWGLMALPLLALYPVGAWRDAPFFPTPKNALAGLDAVPGLTTPARVLDAGCGLGHGLQALHPLWPTAQMAGLERSRVLRWAAAWRCPWARVLGGDMWAHSWAEYDLVYVFQRPESMARAHAKAQHDMAPGSWLVSLEFAVPGVQAQTCLSGPGRRDVWLYRVGGEARQLKQGSNADRRRR